MAAPLSVSGASIKGPAGIVASGLDLSLSMTAQYDAKQLEVDLAPLTIDQRGAAPGEPQAKCARQAGESQPIAVSERGRRTTR